MPAPESPYQPYADVHKQLNGPGDARPTALKVIEDCDLVGKLSNKTIVITGTSAGIGIDTAAALYEAGAKLILTARDIPKLEKIIEDIVSHAKFNKSGPRPEAVEVHLDSLESVRKGAEVIKSKANGKLNILIGEEEINPTTQDANHTDLTFQRTPASWPCPSARTATASRVSKFDR